MKKADSKDKNNKIPLKRHPARREDLFVDKGPAPHMPKNLYLTPKKKKYPAWLIPLIIIVVFLLAVFVILPRLFSDTGDNITKPTDMVNSPETDPLVSTDSDLAVVAKSSAFLFAEADKSSAHLTELLLNESVRITDSSLHSWLGVELSDGLSGYVERSALTADLSSLDSRDSVMKVMIRDPYKRVMSHARGGTLLIEAPMGAVLYADYYNSELLRLKLPGGDTGWINSQGVFLIEGDRDLEMADSFIQSFISTAYGFSNTPFVPGGMTRLGISTEGAVYLAAKLNGFDLPRTAGAMMQAGEEVELADTVAQPALYYLEPGDLLFFHTRSDKEEFDRMALCLSDNRLLLSLSNKASMQVLDFDSDIALDLSERILTVRRLNISEGD